VRSRDISDEEILEFQAKSYPERETHEILPRWRWSFIKSAQRLNVEPKVWMYRYKGKIVAHQGALSVKVKVNNKYYISGWFVETMTLEEVRGKAIGPMVVQKALEELPFNLSLGQTDLMRKLQLNMGWKEVCTVNNYIYAINPTNILQNKIKFLFLKQTVGLIYKIGQNILNRLGCRLPRGEWKLTEGKRFGEEYEQLWNNVENNIKCTVVRDANYMNWKYVEQPGQQFTILELRQDAQLKGVIVLLVKESDRIYNYSRGFILDIVTPQEDIRLTHGLLEGAKQHLRSKKVDMINCVLKSNKIIGHIKRYGFINKGIRHHFLVASESINAEEKNDIFNKNNWYLSMSDSDQDRTI
jgi:hypothetical protein